jgi:thiamine-phosphate pyrophosphorylase
MEPASWLDTARLWLVLDRHAAQPRTLTAAAQLCIAGGVDAVLCRIRDLPRDEVRELALPLRVACWETATPFVMSHDVELTQELHADGLQLGVGDPPLAQLKEALGEGVALGYSTHSVAEAVACQEEGADYVFLGPIFPTPAKLKYGLPLSVSVVAPAVAALRVPVVFIGGITAGNLPEILLAGGRRMAAIAALQAQPDPQAAAARLKALLSTAPIS